MCSLLVDDVDVASMSDGELADAVRELDRVRSDAEARLLAVVGEFEARGVHEVDGSLSAKRWVAARCDLSSVSAGRLVRDARVLRRHPGLLDRCGELGANKTRVLAGAVNARTEAFFAECWQTLADAAAGTDVDGTQRLVREFLRIADPDGPEPADRAANRLSLSATSGGRWALRGDLDAELGAALSAALDERSQRVFRSEREAGDDQPLLSPQQRRAETLRLLVTDATNHQPGTGTPARPLIRAEVDLDTLQGRVGSVCSIDGVGPITGDTARRLACEANVSRVITQGRSAVLDLGLTTRTPSAAMRRLLERRDRHCRFGDCDMPAGWCHAHHIVHWAQGGPTSPENLVLLCSRHHHLVHEGGWTLQRSTDGTLTIRRPDGTLLQPAGYALAA